uniref:Uncharacterized protein n=1 Tax=viral metagenome TaxID=1070528 RepID=A0A6M3X4U6_9ZZZZ
MQLVYFFEDPTIGYCKDCDCLAVWDSEQGLHCPKCKSQDISLFIHDPDSPYPE